MRCYHYPPVEYANCATLTATTLVERTCKRTSNLFTGIAIDATEQRRNEKRGASASAKQKASSCAFGVWGQVALVFPKPSCK